MTLRGKYSLQDRTQDETTDYNAAEVGEMDAETFNQKQNYSNLIEIVDDRDSSDVSNYSEAIQIQETDIPSIRGLDLKELTYEKEDEATLEANLEKLPSDGKLENDLNTGVSDKVRAVNSPDQAQPSSGVIHPVVYSPIIVNPQFIMNFYFLFPAPRVQNMPYFQQPSNYAL